MYSDSTRVKPIWYCFYIGVFWHIVSNTNLVLLVCTTILAYRRVRWYYMYIRVPINPLTGIETNIVYCYCAADFLFHYLCCAVPYCAAPELGSALEST